MEDSQAEAVLTFWFGEHETELETVTNQAKLWWRKDDETDETIRKQFLPLYHDLESGRLDKWKDLAGSRLAMIILADQFSRNMFRNTPRAFALDPLALDLAEGAIETGMDNSLPWPQRIFIYMPLEHTESLAVQEKCLQLFRDLADSVPGDEQDKACGFVDFAIRHWEIIKRFGRFPHRNAILGRESTDEELAFLKQPGSSF